VAVGTPRSEGEHELETADALDVDVAVALRRPSRGLRRCGREARRGQNDE
jgi:hypothetical protein